MANVNSSGKEPALRWNQRELRTSITNKLKEMDIHINPEELKAVMLEQKNELLASCPSNIRIKDFVTEQITSQIINRLAMQGSLTFSPHMNSQPAGMATEAHYRQEFFSMTESLRARLLMGETDSSPDYDQKLKDMMEISQEVWELMKPDLSCRQDTNPRFRDWMSTAREYIEVICALNDEEERRFQIEKVKRKREKWDAATSEDSKERGESEQKQPNKAQKTVKKHRSLNLDAPQRTPMRAAASSSTDSVRTQSLNAGPSSAQALRAKPSLTSHEALDTSKSEQKIKLDKKSVEDQLAKLFGTDDEDEEVSPQQSKSSKRIALEEEIVMPNAQGFLMQVYYSPPPAREDSSGPILRGLEIDVNLDALEKQDNMMGP